MSDSGDETHVEKIICTIFWADHAP
ncbi:hypothetical protein VTH06DRAFT_8637 [Thermothelomyces fergusii]